MVIFLGGTMYVTPQKILLIATSLFVLLPVGINVKKILNENQKIELHNQRVKEAQECMDAKQWKCAENNIRSLLLDSPGNQNLQLHLAGILFEEERYEECIRYIEGLQFEHADLQYLLQKSKQLIREKQELGIENSGHFRLEFEGNPTRMDVMEALSVLEVAYDSLGGLFHFYPEDKIHIVLYKSSEYQGIGPRPDWVGAVFDGKLRIPVGLMQSREVYRPILFHELTHAFIRAMTTSNIPIWMNEGIAQVIDGSKTGKARPAGKTPTLKELQTPFIQESRTEKAELLYWYSEKMVQRLLSYSAEPFRAFHDCLRDIRELGIDSSLKRHFGISEQELFQAI